MSVCTKAWYFGFGFLLSSMTRITEPRSQINPEPTRNVGDTRDPTIEAECAMPPVRRMSSAEKAELDDWS